jgi:hypothetical protein
MPHAPCTQSDSPYNKHWKPDGENTQSPHKRKIETRYFPKNGGKYMKTQMIFALLAITLAACAPAITSTPTETPVPTATSTAILPTFTPAAEMTPDIGAPTPYPTPPSPPILTPDAIQVERWKEYQTALTKGILPTYSFENILCEWDILARSDQEVYVWAVCASPNVSDWRPAVIHLGADGSVQSVEIPKRGSSSDINRMFPEEAQTKFSLYTGDSLFNGRLKEMIDHLNYRVLHPDEPPLIVLSATPTP